MKTSRTVSRRSSMAIAAIGATCTLAAHALGAPESYNCAVNSAASALNFTVSGTAPLSGSFRGNSTIAPPALQTRTKTPPASIFSCGIVAGENDDVSFSGQGEIAGNASNLRPTGSFRFGFDPVANTSSFESGSFDLLGTATVSAASTIADFTASPFCATNPSCSIPISVSFDLPLGNAQITELLAAQSGAATGSLTPAGVNAWTYSIPVIFDVTPTVLFEGQPLPTAPTPVPATITGTVTRSGNNITVSTLLDFSLDQTSAVPVPLPQSPISLTGAPVCNGMNLLLTATINSSTLAFDTNSTISSTGTPIDCPCDANNSGDLTADDIFAFLDQWFAQTGQSGPNLSADFNDSGSVTADDIFAFLDCWFAAPSNLGC